MMILVPRYNTKIGVNEKIFVTRTSHLKLKASGTLKRMQ